MRLLFTFGVVVTQAEIASMSNIGKEAHKDSPSKLNDKTCCYDCVSEIVVCLFNVLEMTAISL